MPRKKEVVSGTFVKYDAVVLGSGPAGEGAAMKLAKSGKRVAIVDVREQLGGNCTHVGTIPSKALRQTVSNIIRYRRDPMFKKMGDWRQFTMKQVLQSAHKVIQQQVETHSRFYDRNEIAIYHGRAYIQDKNTVLVFGADGIKETIMCQQIVIATGSRPYRPEMLDFNHPRVFDSDKILDLDFSIQKIIIYGAGVIGCEYASIFIGLDHKVDLINTQHKLLSYLDDEISDALSYHLRAQGVLIRHNEQIDHLETFDDHVVLYLQSGKKIKADAILWCNGRSGNTDGLGLENVELKPNSRGQLTVNDQYQTEVENIYAAGDVIGWPSLASAAYDQGRCAGANMSGEENVAPVTDIPTGIYTIPEISSIGKTEQELTEEKIPYEVGQASFRHLARAQITGDTVGELKILFHRDTLEVLGVHCFGNNAAEIIHIGQAVMNSPNNTIKYFVETTFNYPTMAEAYRVATLNGMNRLF
ncbi:MULTISPECIES: Si-specific NAD(P)(+) transhydrogenase [Acinetobacter]|jgi:NAD(P) transhydrogenase|uniref:Soluble pyridine nucleotide transhydrogenase n=1 Tax=Acinetobacter towneri TaxID=202956 RepID=A0AB35M143_9GAMM|nr:MULTISPECIES: Si-specific NAD(P)(+) transhydrogenase [Acinetobacter]GIT83585.1 NAD(P)(+) transhydrogenase [Acinetobacter seohaensis]AVH49030.1 Si-specific NAD(P)(+) transhydrogenase [Acinetobacter sp. SWBY1]MBT0888347.1 Si-specific NAD(P)(+) transhydrogenase [Acinetobacter towneri]MCA4778499.1 Si-specific NAD(P)(+) transhydrogenase [Acinetobacter towneri]MCA4783827.1 Si-specific NAD(P)(+) transhydrogenase [Acinetobacter towneri]